MNVYIRRMNNEPEGSYFCECHPLDLPDIAALMGQVGVYLGEGNSYQVEYQFIYDQGRIGAEIVVDDSEEET